MSARALAVYDHPVPARCDTCAMAGSDGDYGTVQTCDAPAMLEDQGDSYDRVTRDIDAWIRSGEVGPCPAWRSAWWNDPANIDDLHAHLSQAGGTP